MSPPAWSRPRRRAVLLVCVLLWIAALATTHIPAERLPQVRISDQVLHLVGFFILGGLFWLTLRAYGKGRRARTLLVLLVMAVYAALDETTQPLFGRAAAWGDWNSDLAGATLAVIVCEVSARLARRKPSPPPG